jgi:hypothetical protein
MALLLNTWTALLLGILYLTFQAFPVIFGNDHGFNEQTTGLAFSGIGLGMLIAISSQPFWNRLVFLGHVDSLRNLMPCVGFTPVRRRDSMASRHLKLGCTWVKWVVS